MIKTQALSRLKSTSAPVVDLAEEYKRLAKALKPQITLGSATILKSSSDYRGAFTLKVQSNLSAPQMKMLAAKAGYQYRHAKTENEYCFGWSDSKQTQFIILPDLGIFGLMVY